MYIPYCTLFIIDSVYTILYWLVYCMDDFSMEESEEEYLVTACTCIYIIIIIIIY